MILLYNRFMQKEVTFEEKLEIELERMEEINAYAQLAASMGVVW